MSALVESEFFGRVATLYASIDSLQARGLLHETEARRVWQLTDAIAHAVQELAEGEFGAVREVAERARVVRRIQIRTPEGRHLATAACACAVRLLRWAVEQHTPGLALEAR